MPTRDKNTIREKNIRVFFIDMVQIAREVASEADLQMRMQGIVLLGAFLKLTPFASQSNMSDDAVYAGTADARLLRLERGALARPFLEGFAIGGDRLLQARRAALAPAER